MRDLYRVFPWVRGAPRGAPGHPLHVPTQGFGRIDNPDRYSTLYIAEQAAAAVAEVLGAFDVWDERLLVASSIGVLSVARFSIGAAHVLDLDAPEPLAERGLIPSSIATRDRTRTQAWAARIFEERRWSGVRWWGYHEATWGSIGLWRTTGMRVKSIEPLTLDHPAVIEAADRLGRLIAR